MHTICVVHTSVSCLAEAEAIADVLIAQRLCACVQITAAGLSMYRWQGKLEQTEEYYLNIKTNQACQNKVIAWLQQSHPYDVPEITWVTQDSSQQYAEWINAEVAKLPDTNLETL